MFEKHVSAILREARGMRKGVCGPSVFALPNWKLADPADAVKEETMDF
jgi:hypothetical protein